MSGSGPVDRETEGSDADALAYPAPSAASAVSAARSPAAIASADEASSLVREAYEEHRSALYGFLVSGTREPELADELLQEAFARLLKVTRAGEPPADQRAWLFRVAGNLAISAARRRATVRRFAPWLARPDPQRSAEDEYLQREEASSLRRELALLQPSDRIALLMAGQGCSTAEIALALGRGQGATRSVLCRARMRLRQRVDLGEVTR